MIAPNFYPALDKFLFLCYERSKAYYQAKLKNLTPPAYSFTEGPKYVKVIKTDQHTDAHGNITPGQRSSYVWINKETGGILKGNWKKVEDKRPRGNIFNANPLEGTTEYGVEYLR